jgi:vacuolar protein sorting-associated protein 45
MPFLLPKISKILSSSQGIKCLLFDLYTKPSLSTLIPHSDFLNNDYFLFDDIRNTRSKININCVCVLNVSSIKYLIEEISDPSYVSYAILFTSSLDPYLLNILAKNDVHNVIEEVFEIYMDYTRQDTWLYKCNKIEDLIYSLGSDPSYFYYKYNREADKDKVISNNINLNKEGGRIFILDRSYDEITPLLIDWHYQSMIKRYCEYNDGMVNIEGRQYDLQDDFFKNNKFRNISDVSISLEEEVKKLDIKKRIKKVNITEIEDINKISEVVNKHMDIYKYIIRNIEDKRRRSEEENKLLKEYKKNRCIGSKKENEGYDDILIEKLVKSTIKYDIKRNEDIKLSYIPPIRKIIKDVIKNKLNDWICYKEKFNKGKYLIFYIKGGVTYTEYRHIVEVCGDMENIYVVSDQIL